MKSFILFCFFVVIAAIAATTTSVFAQTPQPMPKKAFSVNPNTNRIVDEYGRARFFHGANVVTKGPPYAPVPAVTGEWNPISSFVEKDMETMQSLGLNSIRLMAAWPGVFPSEGVVNISYLETLRNIVQKSATYGIYSLLDMHQDSFAETACGEGIPTWLALRSQQNLSADKLFPWPLDKPYKTDANGIPLPSECAKHAWSEGYFSYAAAYGFQGIYDNRDGMQDAFVSFWKTVAAHFSDLTPLLLGFELMNEPWGGNIWAKKAANKVWGPELLLPFVADHVNLQHTWDRVSLAIRSLASDVLIFFEGITFDEIGTDWKHAPGGEEYANRSVIGFHFYQPPDFFPKLEFDGVNKNAKQLKTASFLTEFGVSECPTCGNFLDETLMDLVDSTLQSGFLYWDYKPMVHAKTGYGYSLWFANGTVNDKVRASVSRTYAQAVAGIPLAMFFNRTTKIFTLSFVTDASIVGNYLTEIYYNQQYHYPGGVDVTITHNAANQSIQVPFVRTETFVNVQTVPTLLPMNTTVSVTLAPVTSGRRMNKFKFFGKN